MICIKTNSDKIVQFFLNYIIIISSYIRSIITDNIVNDFNNKIERLVLINEDSDTVQTPIADITQLLSEGKEKNIQNNFVRSGIHIDIEKNRELDIISIILAYSFNCIFLPTEVIHSLETELAIKLSSKQIHKIKSIATTLLDQDIIIFNSPHEITDYFNHLFNLRLTYNNSKYDNFLTTLINEMIIQGINEIDIVQSCLCSDLKIGTIILILYRVNNKRESNKRQSNLNQSDLQLMKKLKDNGRHSIILTERSFFDPDVPKSPKSYDRKSWILQLEREYKNKSIKK